MEQGQVNLSPDDIRRERLRREREFYLSEEGYLDFVRDCGAAPDAQYEPHGKYAQDLIHWNGEADPENTDRLIYKFKLVLWPRGSFKTQAFNIGHVAWIIACNPNVRINVSSETDALSSEIVKKIMDIIDSEWFRERFGVHRGKHWKNGEFTSAQRSKGFDPKEPTLYAGSVGTVRTGFHWDYVFMDDVCSQKNTQTPESIEKLWNWFGETLAQLDPGCKLFVIGTLHHFADIYCRIQKDIKIREMFEISVHAWCEPIVDPESKTPTSLFFPGRLTKKYVAGQKRILPPRLYACFYENKPFTGEDQIFKPEYFRIIRDQDIPRNCWAYIFTDFAFIAEEKRKAKTDRCSFWVVLIDPNRVAYVIDFYVGRWKPSVSCRMICELWDRYQQWNCKAVAVEKSTHSELLSSLFEEIRRQTFTRPRFVLIEGRSQETKDIRIEAVEPRFRNGDIYFAQSVKDRFNDKWKPLIDEMTEWPFSANDDIPDAISDIDKRDEGGRLHFPGPPVGWQAYGAVRTQPVTLDGKWNPRHPWPAQASTRNKEEIWNTKTEGSPDNLFRGSQNQSNSDIWGQQ
jgi:predicted phage terminase large subunit-like protein